MASRIRDDKPIGGFHKHVVDNHVTGTDCGPGYSDSYDETLHSIGFYQPTFTHPSTFDYVYPARWA